MGCANSKQSVVPLYDDLHARGGNAASSTSSEQQQGPCRADGSTCCPPGPSGKSVRFPGLGFGLGTGGTVSKRHVDRKDNQSFFDKSRSVRAAGSNGNPHSSKAAAGTKSQRRAAAFSSRKPIRLDAAMEPGEGAGADGGGKKPCGAAAAPSPAAGGKSRFARSLAAVTDAVFGPPPEWILRQTTPIKSQYQFLGVVGRGQFGQVYCIRHTRLHTKLACKTLGKRKLLSQLDADDIKREIEVMHHLSGHELVVSLHQVFEDERNVHLVMDLCQGDLYEMLREVRYLTEEVAAPLMALALRAVAHCHAMGVLHRDIKPENFLLASRGDLSHIKLTDFGLSTFYQEGQVFNELLGSPYYIAPEVIRQKYGKEADVWSCGVMLYIMLCGEAPFFGEGDEGIFKSIMRAKLDFSFEPWPTLSRDVKTLLRRMLVKDPRERATLEEVLAHPWFAKYKGVPPPPAAPAPSAAAAAAAEPPPRSYNHPLLARLQRYSVAASRTRKAALRYIVASLPDEVTAGLFNLFTDFDRDEDGAVDAEELRAGFAARGVALGEGDARALVAGADLDGDGALNLVEWLGATILIPEDQVNSLVSEAFAFMDSDHDGYLSLAELVAYLGEGQAGQAGLLLAEADSDGDGRVSAEEFRAAYHSVPGLRTARAGGGGGKAGGAGAGGGGGKSVAGAIGEAGGDVSVSGCDGGGAMVRMTSVTSVVSLGGDELAGARGGSGSSGRLRVAGTESRLEED